MRSGLLSLIRQFSELECCVPDENSFKSIRGGDSEIVELGVASEVDETGGADMPNECQFVVTSLLDISDLVLVGLWFCGIPVIAANLVDQSTIESSAGVVHDQLDVR